MNFKAALLLILPQVAIAQSSNWSVESSGKTSLANQSQRARQAKSSKTSTSKTSKTTKASKAAYEVWASDQSNSVPGETSKGVKGSLLWIWDSASIQDQLAGEADAEPLSCSPSKAAGPCDLLDIFPQDLVDDEGNALGDLSGFGRLHGAIKDPSGRYVTTNIFTPGGGYVGVMDTLTKEAIGLFRVTETGTSVGRSVHMSFWSADGDAIIVANLHGKMIERVDVIREKRTGLINDLHFNTDAGVYLGVGWNLVSKATSFSGTNAFGNPLIGHVVGTYQKTDTGDYTPAGKLKESTDRPNNVPICPIPSSNNNAYVTVGGGGLLVLKLDKTPMQIVGEYSNAVVNGAGCGGVETKGNMYINAGVSAGASGYTHSTFTLYSFDDSKFDSEAAPKENYPMPMTIFKDPSNTNTLGNSDGSMASNDSGQLPGVSTRRDSHGEAVTINGKYVHVADRIQNVMEVFDAETQQRVHTYDLVSADGMSGRQGTPGACHAHSVTDDSNLPVNDPAPDLMEVTPDGKHIMIALRGPAPVSVTHSAQGSCPGVGIIELTEGGKSGMLVDVLRTTNTIDTVPVGTITGGINYSGVERSDIHGAIVVSRG